MLLCQAQPLSLRLAIIVPPTGFSDTKPGSPCSYTTGRATMTGSTVDEESVMNYDVLLDSTDVWYTYIATSYKTMDILCDYHDILSKNTYKSDRL